MYPKISIVTPSYNQGEYLDETILSIINQKYPNLEYIIIDGGSTDSSIDIIKKFESSLSYWESKNDSGQAHAINKGFKQCTGDIITFCNSDDMYLPGTFNYIANVWEKWRMMGALVGSFFYMNEQSEIFGKKRKPKMVLNGPTDLSLGPEDNYRLHQASTFFTKQALDRVGLNVNEKYHYVFDRELLHRVVHKYPIYMVNKPLGVFRIHAKSKSMSKILPFAYEFSHLYKSYMTGESIDDNKRCYMADLQIFKGFIKLIKNTNSIWDRIIIALQYIFKYPTSMLYGQRMKKLIWVTIFN